MTLDFLLTGFAIRARTMFLNISALDLFLFGFLIIEAYPTDSEIIYNLGEGQNLVSYIGNDNYFYYSFALLFLFPAYLQFPYQFP